CVDFPRPVIHRADFMELPLEILDVALCADRGMDPFLNGIVFGGGSKCVPTHWVKNVKTLQPFLSRPRIRQDVTSPKPAVQTGTGGERKQIQAVILGLEIVLFSLVQTVRNPVFTPFRLNLTRVVTFSRHDPMII